MAFFHFKKKKVSRLFNEELFLRIREIIATQLDVPEAKITPDSRIMDELGADSLNTVELVMEFEEAFSIEIPDEDAEQIQTVRDIVEYIQTHKRDNIS